MELDTFPLIIDEVKMDLKIAVPVEHCQDCNFAWTGIDAEDIRMKVQKIYYPDHPELKHVSF
jgi:hypothetical protein